MRTAGVVGLIGLLVVFVASIVVSRTPASHPARPDIAGTIQLFGDGTIVVETVTSGLREVLVDARTVVRDMGRLEPNPHGGFSGAPATLADLRPGRAAMVWVEKRRGLVPVASEVGVWGDGR